MAEKDDEKKEPSMEDRLAALEADLARERQASAEAKAQLGVYEKTLSALGPGRQEPQTRAPGQAPRMPLPPLDPAIVAQLQQELGYESPDQVRQLYAAVAPIFGVLAGPLVNQVMGGLTGIADVVDRHDAHLSKSELMKKYGTEMEQERQARMQRGEAPGSRGELLEVIRARHAAEEIQAGVTAKLEEERARAASAAGATTEGTTVGKPSPSPTSTARSASTQRQEGESREDYSRRLEEMAADTPIP